MSAYSSPEFVWTLLGIAIIVTELTFASGIGFLFAGLGAMTIAALLAFNFIQYDFGINVAIFLISSIAWWIILWYPIKFSKRSNDTYQDLVGSVITLNTAIAKGQIGAIVWSGVVMRAALDKEEPSSILSKGEKVKITRISGNILYIIKQED